MNDEKLASIVAAVWALAFAIGMFIASNVRYRAEGITLMAASVAVLVTLLYASKLNQDKQERLDRYIEATMDRTEEELRK